MKHLKLLLKTLISNNACIEAARTKEKKYNIFAIVFGILAIFFAVLPINVTAFQKNGSDFVKSASYNMDKGLAKFEEVTKDKVAFTVTEATNGKHELVVTGDDNPLIFAPVDGCKELTRFVYSERLVPSDPTSEHKALEVYVYTEEKQTLVEPVQTITIETFVRNVLNNVNPYDTSEFIESVEVETEGKTETVKVPRTSSVLIFGKTNFFGYLFQPTNGSPVGSIIGDYDCTATGNLLDRYRDDANNDPVKTLKNWMVLFDEGYTNLRFQTAWRTTGIMIGVDAGIVLFMGFMVWILTRGKNNPYRIYSFWDGQKISYYAALTPGILSLISFIMPNLAIMMFVLIVGVRVMWLSMKSLRQNQAK